MQREIVSGMYRHGSEMPGTAVGRIRDLRRSDRLLRGRIRALEQSLSVLREDLNILWRDAGQAAWTAALDDMGERLGDLEFYIDCREVKLPPTAIERAKQQLSARQVQLLVLAARGLTNAEIAAQTGASLTSVGTHLSALYRKLNVKSRGQAIAVALKNQWISV